MRGVVLPVEGGLEATSRFEVKVLTVARVRMKQCTMNLVKLKASPINAISADWTEAHGMIVVDAIALLGAGYYAVVHSSRCILKWFCRHDALLCGGSPGRAWE